MADWKAGDSAIKFLTKTGVWYYLWPNRTILGGATSISGKLVTESISIGEAVVIRYPDRMKQYITEPIVRIEPYIPDIPAAS